MLLPIEAQVRLNLRWSTVVGTFLDTRDLQVTKNRGPLGGGVATG